MCPGEFDDLDSLSTTLRPRPAGTSGVFLLTVVEGPDQGRSFRCDEASPSAVLLGQSEVCAIRLSDNSVSRRHASLEVIAGKLKVLDLGSSNGTFVQGVAVVVTLIGHRVRRDSSRGGRA